MSILHSHEQNANFSYLRTLQISRKNDDGFDKVDANENKLQ